MDDPKERVERLIYEHFVSGRPLSDTEWNVFRPKAGETLPEAATGWEYVRDHEAELRELAELRAPISSEDVARTRMVRLTVGLARQAIFEGRARDIAVQKNVLFHAREHGSPIAESEVVDTPPPFRTLSEASNWVGNEEWGEFADLTPTQKEAMADAEILRSIDMPFVEADPHLSPPDFPVSENDRHYFLCPDEQTEELRTITKALAEAWDEMPKIDQADSRSEKKPGKRTTKAKIVTSHGNEEGYIWPRVVTVYSQKLALLALWSAYLSFITDNAWSRDGCVVYILTGQLPHLPKMRIREKLLGVSVELYVPVTMANLRLLYDEVRELRGVKHKKDFTTEDADLMRFVEAETPDLSFSERLVLWEKNYPDHHHYKRGQDLWRAYKSAVKRQRRPKF
jgi:hypothetical protein